MSEVQERDQVWTEAHQLGIVGKSDALYRVISSALNVAPTEASVLIVGANGTGKEQIARLIHEYSQSGGDQFLAVNCAAIAPNLFESEMFGHEKGAFTGADKLKRGVFELAHRGTLFLDELGEMPIEQQAKLLRVMEIGRCRRVGSNSQEDNIDARPRIIAATNIDITDALRKGKLREDLYYRLTRHIELPPLSQRPDDIPLLAQTFLDRFNENQRQRRGIYPRSFHSAAIKRMQAHSWPGNVRELRGVVENAFIDARGLKITEADLSILPHVTADSDIHVPEPYVGFDSKHYLDEIRNTLYGSAIKLAGGNLSRASRLLSISKQTLQQWNDKRP